MLIMTNDKESGVYACVGREENVQRAARCDSLLSLLSRRSYVASTSIESV